MEFHIQNIEQYLKWVISLILEHLPSIILAIIIFIFGLIIIKIIKNSTQNLLFKTKLDKTVTMLLMQILHIFLMMFVILIALSEIGISTTPITASITALLVGIGMSLRTSTNIIVSGIMIASTRPFKIGDFISLGEATGTVESINFVFCTLHTTDGQEIKIPNSLVTSCIITNFSNSKFRRNDFIIGIVYDSNLKAAKNILEKIIESNEQIIKDDTKMPIIRIDSFADNSINFIIRYWTKSSDFLETKWLLAEKIKLSFDEKNIQLAFPQKK